MLCSDLKLMAPALCRGFIALLHCVYPYDMYSFIAQRVFTNIFIASSQLCFPAPYFLEVILECLSSHQFLNVGSQACDVFPGNFFVPPRSFVCHKQSIYVLLFALCSRLIFSQFGSQHLPVFCGPLLIPRIFNEEKDMQNNNSCTFGMVVVA